MLGGRRVFSQICCWTSNIPPMWRKVADGKVKQLWDKQWKWTSSCFTFCTLIWRLMWVVPLLVVSGASQVAVCWTSFQSYNSLQGGERTRWKSHFFAAPHHHHCELSVVSVNSNGDGLLLVMDTAFGRKVKVFLVLMQVAVVGVVGVVGVVMVVLLVLVLSMTVVSATDIYRWIAVPNSFTVPCSSFTWNWAVSLWMTMTSMMLVRIWMTSTNMMLVSKTTLILMTKLTTDQFWGVCCPRNIQRSKLLGLGRGRR